MQRRILDILMERKVIEVIPRNNKDTIYQLKGDSFPANWINKYIFTSKQLAENKIKENCIILCGNYLDVIMFEKR